MRLTFVLSLVLWTAAVSAQIPPADDRFYPAIRHDDLAMVKTLVRENGVDARDAQGQTPLMLAAARSGVTPNVSGALTDAPRASSSRTASAVPLAEAATSSGVLPTWDTACTSAPASRRRRVLPTSMAAQ